MLDYLTLTPSFPRFQGPLNVGTTTFEIPVAEIDSPPPALGERISTIKARVFYPTSATTSSKSKPVWWVQEPQAEALGAFSRFLGASHRMARAISYIPSFVKRTKIPAIADGPILDPPEPQKGWPVAIFSHGLGGTFNTYSYLAGTLASCGLVVFAIEHRDGSAPISVVSSGDGTVKLVEYQQLSHDPEPDILDVRNDQLRHRMLELDLLYSIVEQLNAGASFTNLATKFSKKRQADLLSLASRLDLSPSKVVWMGHSFGAATMVQFLKSVYWSRSFPESVDGVSGSQASYAAVENGKLCRQVTSKSPIVLLDLWTMPLRPERSRWFYEQPLPCFDDQNPTATTVLSIMSEEFQGYSDLLRRTKYLLSGSPKKSEIKPTRTSAESARYGPKLFFVNSSAHLSQSDFGLLFPWVARRFMGAAEPERIMNLNIRAILQLLRENNHPVRPVKRPEGDAQVDDGVESPNDDTAILQTAGNIRNWTTIALVPSRSSL